VIVFWFSIHTAYSEELKVDYIPSSQYFETTLNEISNAKVSIQVFMYLISVFPDQTDSQAQKLVQALVDAQKRGVKVNVILDQTIDFQGEVNDADVYGNKNQKAYEFLKRNNIPVFFDEASAYTHAKAIIIDNETVILGSSNWSKAALTQNHEANNIVRSKEFALKVLNDMAAIEIQEVPAVITPSINIPKEFLTDKKLLGEMASQADERAFDTYIYLLGEYSGNKESKVILDYDKLAASLGINQMTTEDYRRQISKVLDKLRDKYKLIDYKVEGRNQPAQVILKDLNDSKNNYILPEQNFFEFPTTYWKYGWNRSLTFPSKVMCLIVKSYTSPSSPSFFMSRETLAKSHSISASFITDGTRELKRLNLLSIKYGDIEGKNYSDRDANVYTPKFFYDPEDLKKELKHLSDKHGQDKFQRAIEVAKIIFEENNSKTIQTLIELETKYGQETVQTAAKQISEKNPDNPKRSIGYLINTVKNIANQKN